ncbi:putative bifunctional diguanylate cyclase/phosphodiesterase [Wenzhouxiangella sp. EGI_FJ10305]|uniref:putative bifunctional diguanylate cyclase/phosphodiesterase n=1 Tax=Wenzhouxiangella sp. EGI_FJ10305 TaxID=3243768 RepID=UPI0035D960FB
MTPVDPDARAANKRPQAWRPWVAGLLVLAGVTGTLFVYRGLQSAEEESLSRYVDNLAGYIEADMLADLGEQINAHRRMAARLAHDGLEDSEGWDLNAELFLDHYGYYRTLAVLGPELQVLWVRNQGVARVGPGEAFPVDEEYRPALARARATGEIIATRPRFLSDGRPGISLIAPVGANERHVGYLATTMDIPEAIDAMIPALFRESLDLHAVARGREVYPYPPQPAPPQWDSGFSVDLDEDQAGFLFEFAVSDEIREQLSSAMPEVVLISGILLSLLLSAVVYLGLGASVQARVMARANRRLEQEIGERQAAERELGFLVKHDGLTGLPNRSGISEHLADMIEDHADRQAQLAVLFLDLDQFKDINDSLGHQLGDQLLCEVPRRLAGVLRDRDFVGRHGGDEFLIAVERVDREQVEQLAANILRALDSGFAVDDHRLFISGSIGIAYYPESGRSVSELIQNADTALFKAKNAGRNQFAVFTREMFAQAQHRLNLSRDIRHALEDGDFRVVYQPIVDIRDLSMSGVEALLRWEHRDGYTVPPQEFIRVAEETGIIGRLGEFALDRALSDLAHWKTLSDEVPGLAVNVSGAQIHEAGFAEQLSVLLHQHRIEPEQLHLEITEEVLIENLASNRRMLHKLDEIGMRIVVDDFGVGYSSLSYLKNFPISVVKIDRGFVHDIVSDPEDQAITRTICSLAADLGMQTVAEGVETDEQLALLASYRCSFAQGFLFARPAEADEIAGMISRQLPWRITSTS